MLETSRFISRMPQYPEIEWTREQAEARNPRTSVKCCTCQHRVDFTNEREMGRFLESSFWIRVDNVGFRCPVCQDRKA
jgi:hypothetical protein